MYRPARHPGITRLRAPLHGCGLCADSPDQNARAAEMTARAPYDSRAIANFLLDLAEGRKLRLTQLSLYKIIYFAHGWYLAETGTPLVAHDFEAWKFGPVIKVLRDEFGALRDKPITTRAFKLDIFSGGRSLVPSNLDLHDSYFVRRVFEAYHVHDAWKLSEMTHESGSPWDLLWNANEPIGRLGLRIKNSDIKEHFAQLPQRFRLV
jgi:uncharacterized phage-associated protein